MTSAPIPADEAARIETLRRYAILDTEPEAAFDRITAYIAKQFGVEIALVSLVDTDRQWFKSSCGLDAAETPRDLAFCAFTILDTRVHYVPDASKDERFKDNPLVTGPPNIRFYCGAPLIAPNGQALGSLCIIDSTPRPDFSEADQALLQDMAAMVVDQMEVRKAAGDVALEIETRVNAEASAKGSERKIRAFVENVPVAIALIGRDGTYHARSKRWLALQAGLFDARSQDDFVRAIRQRDDWSAAFDAAVSGQTVVEDEGLLEMLDGSTEYAKWELNPWFGEDGAVEGAVMSVTNITEQVTSRLETERRNELFNAVLENIEDGIVACDHTGRLTLFNSQTRRMHGLDIVDLPIEECGEFYSLFEEDGITPLGPDRVPLFRALGGERVVNQPMVIAPEGLPRRDIVAQATPLRRESGALIGAVASMADVTASKLATQRLKDSEARAVHIAFHDTLTGLANRAKFRELCDNGELDGDAPRAALFIDLNRFKIINDTLGHKVGDDLLIRVAEILTDVTGPDAFVARFGGDEFVAVLRVRDEAEACDIGQALIDRLNTPIIIAGHTVVTGAAIGVAVSPHHGETVEALVRRADIAMYRGKTESVETPVLFEPVFELETIERKRLESELIQSIRNEELNLVFQPIVCGKDHQLRGLEALIRWDHPRLGRVSPDRFIPVAEECGFIVELGEWVLEQAVSEIAALGDLFVSVNLSPVQFRDPRLVEKIMSTLQRASLPPERLELEITESLLINDTKVARRVIDRLKAEGVRIALDDFGTGYSSLSYIHEFPFDKVKIDRSFVAQLGASEESEAVVRCVVNLASSMGMIVTAEGVETRLHETMLKLIGCHTLQGYKYGRPAEMAAIRSEFDLKAAG